MNEEEKLNRIIDGVWGDIQLMCWVLVRTRPSSTWGPYDALSWRASEVTRAWLRSMRAGGNTKAPMKMALNETPVMLVVTGRVGPAIQVLTAAEVVEDEVPHSVHDAAWAEVWRAESAGGRGPKRGGGSPN